MAVKTDDADRMRLALGRISRLVERQVSGGILTRTQVSVLGTVARRGPLRASDLAEHEGVNPTMLSRLLGKLETAGLLLRTNDADDGRVVLVEVTRAGADLDAQLRRQRTALFASKLADLPPDQRARLIEALPALESLAELLRQMPLAAGVLR